jgi:uncharacterized protein
MQSRRTHIGSNRPTSPVAYAPTGRNQLRTKPLRILSNALFVFATLISGACAEPALWVAHSATATVYFFGTIHLLKHDTPWRSDKLDQALAQSKGLWLELSDAFDTAAAGPLVQQYGIDPEHPLSTKLDANERERLDAVVRKEGLGSAAAFESFRPWMAALVISVTHIVRQGYNTSSGVEKILSDEMTAAGKPIYGLETIEQQLHFFTTLPPGTERQMLDQAMDDVDAESDKTDAIITAWIAGDVATLAKLIDQDIAANEPDAYRALVVNRNIAWAKYIEQLLKGPGVSFIAVGAGHLAGPDSVQAQLAKHGIEVQRE